ncbi:PACE efflux transporter [Wielerella bovis]|uniref:PACE efflux transporter n=1 Tax=Wielerella bovis TaxID=2917790 RepID=UPI00201883E7|nr:PACE efflux transporter [Wielerella bovis]ULJ62307.1 PACE efflux transporter [Wielerella bovis]
MTKKERIFQAILFEALLVIISTLLLAAFTSHGIGEMGALFIIISLIALAWNMLFNWLFDQKFTAPRIERSLKIRALHATLFEGGLMLLTVPLIAWWLNITWWHAIIMDISMTLGVMIYTVIFHWCYDHLREKIKKAA